jgi:5'-methylthioadenosine phosphorylase
MATADLGVFGGTGFYSFLDAVEEVEVDTPYGPPSAPVTFADVNGTRVAFLPRHGRAHELPPHRINFRANLWALKEVGVTRVIGPCACGALDATLARGEFVVLDQFVDRTWGRGDTFYDGAPITHVSAAEPYCPDLRRVLVETARELGIAVRDGGTVVVVQGPRFSSVAESLWFAGLGWHVVNMTQYPECHLARELELCYAGVAMVTDYDVGVEGIEAVSARGVQAVFAENLERLRALLLAAIPRIGPQPADVCATALSGARL